MCPTSVVKLFFTSLDFEVTRPWVMPDDCCVTVYTPAELPLLLASPKVQRSILKIPSRYSIRLLGTSTFPVSILSQFSHAFFSSLGRSQSTICYNIFPADLTGEANSEGSFISAIFRRISLLVTLTIGVGKATTIVSTALFHGTPSSLVSPVFTPIWYLAKLWLLSAQWLVVVPLFPPRAWQGCDLLPVEWLNVILPLSLRMVALLRMAHFNAMCAAFSGNRLGCSFLSYTSNQVVNIEAPFNFFDFVWEVLLKVSQVLIYNSSKKEW